MIDNKTSQEKSVNELQMLNRLAQSISSTLEVEKILEIIVKESMAATSAKQGSILSLQAEGERQMVTRFKSAVDGCTGERLSRLSDLVGGWLLKNGDSLITENISKDDRFIEAKQWLKGIASVLAVPMIVAGTITGIIILTKKAKFAQTDLDLMTIVANQCGQFLENAKQYQKIYHENMRLRREVEQQYSFHGLIGNSPAMLGVFELLHRIIPGETRILIEGESGTGKELIARTIHYNGPRKANKFVPVDCGALPETLLESELFGHVKGAFTGATSTKKGLFEVAHQGTLFLDEITNTSITFQAKLLRAIQEGEIKPVGAEQSRKVDVRIIVATSGDLKAEVAAKEFREDLYYRLNIITIQLPPLRERKEDIRLLADHFLNQYLEKTKQAKQLHGFAAPAMRILENYDWPGNIRELENIIERAVTLAHPHEQVISPELLPDFLIQDRLEQVASTSNQHPNKLVAELDQTERRMIIAALEKYDSNRSQAAKSLGVARTTLLLKMKKHQL
jgi:transcriptional regulator with GAF, ATPase, and Fis domain